MAVPLSKLTVDQYLEIERAAEYKSEYYQGEMFAMAGASLNHISICSNIMEAMFPRLSGSGCKVYGSDMRLQCSPAGLYTYPDITIVCGKPKLAGSSSDILINPKLIFEVLSKSTEAKDRNFKFQHYKQIASLEEYILVSQYEPLIESFSRRPGAPWSGYSEARGLESSLLLKSLDIEIPLAEIYGDINFETAASE